MENLAEHQVQEVLEVVHTKEQEEMETILQLAHHKDFQEVVLDQILMEVHHKHRMVVEAVEQPQQVQVVGHQKVEMEVVEVLLRRP